MMTRFDGTVRETVGGVYRVRFEDGSEVEASLRGRLKRDAQSGDRVVIGDRVEVRVEAGAGHATIERVHERRTLLARSSRRGRRRKVIAANLDRLIVVAAVADPPPQVQLIDRLLVAGESGGLEGVLVVNKVDLPGAGRVAEELEGTYRTVGYPVVLTSPLDGTGLDAFRDLVCRGGSALVGPSGVGKSTLLNWIEPGLRLRTGEVGQRSRRGTHTTVSSSLIELSCGGAVADTPGFSEVGLWGVDADGLDRCFPEFRPLLPSCRFRGCAHENEPDCAVRAALAEGLIPRSRYESYLMLLAESREGRR